MRSALPGPRTSGRRDEGRPDANVIVSALINPQGAPAQVFDAWRAERFQLLMSPAILEEIGRVLRYPRLSSTMGGRKNACAFGWKIWHSLR